MSGVQDVCRPADHSGIKVISTCLRRAPVGQRGDSQLDLCQALPSQRVLSTCIVESRVSIIGITIMVWVSDPI